MFKALISERTILAVQTHNQYTFAVDPLMTKEGIKQRVEGMFGVHVKKVQTINTIGKDKHFGKKKTAARVGVYKKAIVTLAEKEKIHLFDTEEKGKKK